MSGKGAADPLPEDGFAQADSTVPFRVLAIVASAGSLQPLTQILRGIPAFVPLATVVLQHRSAESRLAEFLGACLPRPVREAREGDRLETGAVLVAPPGVHVVVDSRGRVRLLDGPRIGFCRPSGDVLFASIASAFGDRAIGVVLSGCGSDGALGARAIRQAGGMVLVQDPATCIEPDMPLASIAVGMADLALRVDQFIPALVSLPRREAAYEFSLP